MFFSRRHLFATAACVLSLGIVPGPLHAAQETGTITVEQQSPNDMIGSWVLIRPGNKRLSLRKQTHTIADAEAGNYTIIVEPPAGAETTVRLFLDQDLIDSYRQPQASFALEPNVHIRVEVEYIFLRVGVIGVNSQPPGLGFVLRGPNSLNISGKTPRSYKDMPEGLYSITYDTIRDCPVPKPASDKLVTGSRINFTITFNCEGVKNMEQQQTYEKTLQFVTAEIGGEQVTFTDVPLGQWFATYVNTVLKTGIMTGYSDSAGNPTGAFGPGDNVTVAQLAKIAHTLAGIDQNQARQRTSNPRARGTWFEKYFSSAEERDWHVYRDHRMDPARDATRGEVVATILQALNIRRFWPQGAMFNDVRRNTDYASSIETAAADGIVSGFTDANGKPTGQFGPTRPVNRAEIAKIISTAIDTYEKGSPP